MARVTKRKATNIAVPTLEQDAAERKRVLNVLAQRRYRERRRQRFQELEKKINTNSNSSSDASPISNKAGMEDSTSVASDQSLDFASNDFPSSSSLSSLESADWDTSVLFPSLSTPGTVSKTTGSSPTHSGGGVDIFDMPTTTMTSTGSNGSSSMSFSDEAFLPILELNILKAGVAIAKRLDVEPIIWDLASLSPFNHTTNLNYDHLPINLRPTLTQLTIPHHPMLDILPWPEVRDKMIFVFSQPEHLRPPVARSPTACVGFVYDLEDSAEGIRVTGDDPYACDNWELGQKVFSNWWWAFTKEIVDHSNAVRKARGASKLTGTVLGEVT